MLRKFIRAGLFAALGVIAMTLAYGAAATAGQDKKDDKKKDEKIPSISDIMLQGHKGTDSFLGKLKGEVKDAKWADALDHAKALNLFGEALGKNKPPKGDEKSWKELTGKYAENTKSVLTAVEKKDAKAATTALGAIGGMCMGCHKAHR
jgi:hypothetical protein